MHCETHPGTTSLLGSDLVSLPWSEGKPLEGPLANSQGYIGALWTLQVALLSTGCVEYTESAPTSKPPSCWTLTLTSGLAPIPSRLVNMHHNWVSENEKSMLPCSIGGTVSEHVANMH